MSRPRIHPTDADTKGPCGDWRQEHAVSFLQCGSATMWAGCSWRALSGTFLHHSMPTPELSNPFRGAEFLAISVVGPIAGYTKFAIIAGKSSSEFHRATDRVAGGAENSQPILRRKSKHACKARATPAFARQSDATVGIDRSASVSLPKHLACESTSEFFAAACEVSTHREKFRTDCALCIPTAIVTVEASNMDNTKTPEVLAVIPLPMSLPKNGAAMLFILSD
jgi:hypothetical protein